MVFTGQFDHPSSWKRRDLPSKDHFSFDLQERHREAFRALIARVGNHPPEATSLSANEAAMPEIADDLASLRHEVTRGRGLVVVRGIPVDEMTEQQLSILFWAIGTHLGVAVPQSPRGDRIGRVADTSRPNQRERAYRTSQELSLHTDSDEIVGLLCLRRAMSGGYTRLASALAIHNEMARHWPALLEPLYEGFRYHWFGEQPAGAPPITDYSVPLFSVVDGLLSACYIREFIHSAAWELRRPLSRLQEEALACFDHTADRRDIVVKFMLEPGEASFINNYTVLHSRTAFNDWPEPERKRLLLRLWLQAAPPRPIHPNLKRFYEDRLRPPD